MFDVGDQVDFLLWTRENPDTANTLIVGNMTALALSHFRKDLPTRILIHGYEDTGTTRWVLNVRDAYFIKGKPYVVLVLDENSAIHTFPLKQNLVM